MYGKKLLGLLDSGASRTILGGKGYDKLRSLNLRIDGKIKPSITVANGDVCSSLGTVMLPFMVGKKTRLLKVLIVPAVHHTLILGTDFWKKLGIVPDLRKGEWIFSPEADVASISDKQGTRELTAEQRRQLEQLVEEFKPPPDKKFSQTTLVEHVIRTTAEPIKQRYYPVSPVVQKRIDHEIDKMLADGVIEPSDSPWSSPILLVAKKNGEQRLCVDFRKLNQVSKKDAYPLPYVSHFLDKLGNAIYLSTIDLKSAFWQIALSKGSRQYTAFTVPGRGLFQFRSMPFGLSNAPASWQRLIDRVLGSDLEPYVFAYLDDVVVITDSFEKHMEILREVLKRITQAGLTINYQKSKFCRERLTYLGYVVDKDGLHVDPDKVAAIMNLPVPTTVKQVRSILGTMSWYRRFVPDFSTLIAPLTALLKKGQKFSWNEERQKAFEEMKERLINAPILSCPNYDLPFHVQTDASAFGTGAVLTRPHPDGEKVICYISRSLTAAERKYTTIERECLAVIHALEKLRPYLEGVKFTVITDHHSLLWLHRLKDPTGRLARWAVRLQVFDFEIIHRKGKDNVVPDMLSRSVPIVDVINQTQTDQIQTPPAQDKWLDRMKENILAFPSKYPSWTIIGDKVHKYVRPKYSRLIDDQQSWKEVPPKSSHTDIIREHHDPPNMGHFGISKTLDRVQRNYYWPGMKSSVVRYIQRCRICSSVKPEQRPQKGKMGKHPIPTTPWQMISTDIFGPLPRSKRGYVYILVVTDYFSKFSLFFPLRKATATTISQAIEDHVFMIFGVPQVLLCDNGTQYRSKEFRSLLQRYGIEPMFNPAYHAQVNPTERVNRVLKTMLASYVGPDHRNWAENLSKIACATRTAKHDTINVTPYFAHFGREMILNGRDYGKVDTSEPIRIENRPDFSEKGEALKEVFLDIRKHLQLAYQKEKCTYDLRRREVEFHLGDSVWRKNHVLSDASKQFTAKLAPKYLGPYRITEKLSKLVYRLDDNSGVTWHVKDLKRDYT